MIGKTMINTGTCTCPGADPGFSGKGGAIRQGALRVLLLLSQMFMERMMQEN